MNAKYKLTHLDDSSAKVAAYESLLDLFTLVSFVMIFAAVIYVSTVNMAYKDSSLVDSRIARRGAGTAQVMPRDGVLITIYRNGAQDELSFMNYETMGITNRVVQNDDVDSVLNEFFPLILEYDKTNVAISGDKGSVNAKLLFAVQLWLTDHDIKYHLYFRPTNDSKTSK